MRTSTNILYFMLSFTRTLSTHSPFFLIELRELKKMIQPLYSLVLSEVAILLLLLFKTPLRNPLVMLLGRFKRGRGPVIAKTAGGTLLMVLISIFYNMSTINTDHLLLANHLLEASLLGFSLFLAMMIDRIHYYIKELQTMRKDLEATTKKIQTRHSQELYKTASEDE